MADFEPKHLSAAEINDMFAQIAKQDEVSLLNARINLARSLAAQKAAEDERNRLLALLAPKPEPKPPE
jgi:hypothetical protein